MKETGWDILDKLMQLIKNTNKKLDWVVLIIWILMLLSWLIMGLITLPSLFSTDFLKKSVPVIQVDADWLVDTEWPDTPICNSDNKCIDKTLKDSREQVNLSLDKIYEGLMQQKVAEVLLSVRKDRENPKNDCFRKSMNECLSIYAQGISSELVPTGKNKRKISTNQLLLAVSRLKAIDKAREGGDLRIPNETFNQLLALTANALGRDIVSFPWSLEGEIEKLYKENIISDEEDNTLSK